jgi:hypothetical protein
MVTRKKKKKERERVREREKKEKEKRSDLNHNNYMMYYSESFLSPVFSDTILVAWNWPLREYLFT